MREGMDADVAFAAGDVGGVLRTMRIEPDREFAGRSRCPLCREGRQLHSQLIIDRLNISCRKPGGLVGDGPGDAFRDRTRGKQCLGRGKSFQSQSEPKLVRRSRSRHMSCHSHFGDHRLGDLAIGKQMRVAHNSETLLKEVGNVMRLPRLR